MRTLICAVGFAAVLLPGPCLAQTDARPDTLRDALWTTLQKTDPDTLPLRDLEAIALSGNPSLDASRFRAEWLETRIGPSTALPDPMVSLTTFPAPVYTARGAQRAQLRVEQLIPFPGVRLLRESQALDAHEAAVHGTRAMAADVLLAVRDAYFELAGLQAQIVSLSRFAESLIGFEDAAASQYETGRGPQQAILRVQLERNGLDSRRLDLERRVAAVLGRLRIAMGGVLPDELSGKTARLPSNPGLDPDAPIAAREEPRLERLEALSQQADAAQDLAELRYWPDIAFHIQYMEVADGSFPASANGRDAIGIGAAIRLPLQKGPRRADVEAAKLHRQQIDAEIRRETISVDSDRIQLSRQIDIDQENLSLIRSTLSPQADATLQAATTSYRSGTGGFLDLLDAHRALFDLDMHRITIEARLARAHAAYDRALGVSVSSSSRPVQDR